MAIPPPALDPPAFDWRSLAEFDTWLELWTAARERVVAELWSLETGVAAAAVIGACLVALALKPWVDRLLERLSADDQGLLGEVEARLRLALTPLLIAIGATAAGIGVDAAGFDSPIPRVAASLAAAWLVIGSVAKFIEDPFWAKTLSRLAWILAVLNIFGLLGAAGAALDSVAFTSGETRISLLVVLRAVVIVIALFALASWASDLLRRRIERLPRIEPSLRLLFAKSVQIGLLGVAAMVGLSTIGIDLSALAIVGGAVGLGIGFGLQKIFSNLVSGVILLLDRSIKPGDVIEVDDTYGWVNSLGLRYASVVTRDGTEHLIPNEMLMTEKVVNWSFSNRSVRVKRPVGIAYGSDVRKAIAVCEAAARDAPRTLDKPAPRCLLIGFGDSSVDLEIRFWIDDPEDGVALAANDVLLRIWDAFKAEGIEIPFPQRDLHIKSAEPLAVRVRRDDDENDAV